MAICVGGESNNLTWLHFLLFSHLAFTQSFRYKVVPRSHKNTGIDIYIHAWISESQQEKIRETFPSIEKAASCPCIYVVDTLVPVFAGKEWHHYTKTN